MQVADAKRMEALEAKKQMLKRLVPKQAITINDGSQRRAPPLGIPGLPYPRNHEIKIPLRPKAQGRG